MICWLAAIAFSIVAMARWMTSISAAYFFCLRRMIIIRLNASAFRCLRRVSARYIFKASAFLLSFSNCRASSMSVCVALFFLAMAGVVCGMVAYGLSNNAPLMYGQTQIAPW